MSENNVNRSAAGVSVQGWSVLIITERGAKGKEEEKKEKPRSNWAYKEHCHLICNQETVENKETIFSSVPETQTKEPLYCFFFFFANVKRLSRKSDGTSFNYGVATCSVIIGSGLFICSHLWESFTWTLTPDVFRSSCLCAIKYLCAGQSEEVCPPAGRRLQLITAGGFLNRRSPEEEQRGQLAFCGNIIRTAISINELNVLPISNDLMKASQRCDLSFKPWWDSPLEPPSGGQ